MVPPTNINGKKNGETATRSIKTETPTWSRPATGIWDILTSKLSESFSPTATNVIVNSFRDSTRKQYNYCLIDFLQFHNCSNVLDISPVDLVNYLAHLFDKGKGYSALNTARSAVSSFISTLGGPQIGTDPIVCWFLKGHLI